ncbi:hypothetical protein [Sphingobium sp. Cam5-1]|uniref:hypothetical protein n=1 Tax=Sphingobium sp. Cam5-1 TaxID=2789327 RepID=UPI0018AD1911|nr:hypothetical protein [Sphingobium sp. Cam5-1]QPI75068.1 hypothetical protein IZV00_15325 [Sphingobium sp. Cam5-1]
MAILLSLAPERNDLGQPLSTSRWSTTRALGAFEDKPFIADALAEPAAVTVGGSDRRIPTQRRIALTSREG